MVWHFGEWTAYTPPIAMELRWVGHLSISGMTNELALDEVAADEAADALFGGRMRGEEAAEGATE